MDETQPPGSAAAPGTTQTAVLEPPASPRSDERFERASLHSVERAALRELRARESLRHAAEDAQDRAERERLRKERVAAADARAAELRALAADHAVAEVLRREPWVDAHQKTVQERRAGRALRRDAMPEYRRQEEHRRQELRDARNELADRHGAVRRQLAADEAGEDSRRRDAWLDAHQRTVAAHRSARKELRKVRRSRREGLSARMQVNEQARKELAAIRAERAEEVRAAVKERATASVLLRDAQRSGTQGELRRAREQEQALRAAETEVKDRGRAERNAEDEALFARRQHDAKEKAAAYAAARDPWLAARQEEAVERRKKNQAHRAAGRQRRVRRREVRESLRAERVAAAAGRAEEGRQLDTERALLVVQTREGHLYARAEERTVWKRVKRDGAPGRAAEAAQRRAVQERLRAERNALDEEHFSAIQRLARERTAARAAERDAARASASDAYRAMRAEVVAAAAAAPIAIPLPDGHARPDTAEERVPFGGKAVERALGRVAARTMSRLRDAQYAAEDKADRAELERLRHIGVANDDARAAAAWEMAVARELASAERRVPWLEARGEAIDLKHEAQAAQKAAREAYRPYEEEQRARLRAERLADEQDRFDAAYRAGGEQALQAAERHRAWIDACEASAATGRAVRAELKARRQTRKEARPAAREAAEHARAERNAAAEARRQDLARAVQEYEVAAAMRRETRRSGTRAEYEQARIRELELRAVAHEVRNRVREERYAAAYRRFTAWRTDLSDRMEARRALRDERRAAHFEKTVERKKMRAADRAARIEERPARRLAAEHARAERNAAAEARAEAGRALNRERELMLVDLQEAYVDARAEQHAAWKRVKAADKPARAADLAAERAVCERHRAERLAEEEARRAAAAAIAKERTFARSQDRDAALGAARRAYRSMSREGWSGSGGATAAQA